jgi:polar amino acid transport system substrate-binding protein
MADHPTSDRRLLLAGGIGLAGVLAAARPATAQAASTWEQIRTRGELRIGAAPSEPWYAKDSAAANGAASAGRWAPRSRAR